MYEEGGIYFYTDVEMGKPFPHEILTTRFIGIEKDFTVCSAVIEAFKKEV